MSELDVRELLEAKRRQAVPPADAFDRLAERRRRRTSRRRAEAALVAMCVAGAGLGISFAVLGSAGRKAAPRPSTVLSWAPDVPLPPARFGLRPAPEPVPYRGGPVWSLTSPQAYLAQAVDGADQLLAFYRKEMTDRGWGLDWQLKPVSMAKYEQVETTYIAGQTWIRGARGIRLFITAFQSTTPTLDLTLSAEPLVQATLPEPESLPGQIGRLDPLGDYGDFVPMPIKPEEAVRLAAFYIGTEASRVQVRLGVLVPPHPRDRRIVWDVAHEPCASCSSERILHVLIDASDGTFVARFTRPRSATG